MLCTAAMVEDSTWEGPRHESLLDDTSLEFPFSKYLLACSEDELYRASLSVRCCLTHFSRLIFTYFW